MNTNPNLNGSLSTVDSIFTNVIMNTNGGACPNHRGGAYMTHATSSVICDPLNHVVDERDKVRASPSFLNDSEPPSYFEAVGIIPNGIQVIGGSSRLQSLGQRMNQPKPKATSSHIYQNHSYASSMNKSISMTSQAPSPLPYQQQQQQPSMSTSISHQPNHQRQHVMRAHHLPPIYQQAGNASYSYSSHALGNNSHVNNSNSSTVESQSQKPSETYLIWSIFTTIYCVIIGVPALVLSIQVYHYNKQGEYQKAFNKSKLARNVNFAGLFVGIVYLAIGFLACFLPR